MKRLVLVFAWLLASSAYAQIQEQPTEYIVATPLSPFSARAANWPSQTYPTDSWTYEVEPPSRNLNMIPGVHARESSPLISIRGSGQFGRVLTLFDDVPLDFTDGFAALDLLVPKEIVGETQLLKGPAAVLYGPSAVGGVIQHRPRIFEDAAIRGGLSNHDGGSTLTNLLGVIPYSWGNGNFVQVSALTENDPGDFPFESKSTGLSGRRIGNNTHRQRFTLIGQQVSEKTVVSERFVFGRQIGSVPGSVNSPSIEPYRVWAGLGSVQVRSQLSSSSIGTLQYSHVSQDRLDNRQRALESRSRSYRNRLSGEYEYVFSNLVISRTLMDGAIDYIDVTGPFLTGEYAEATFEAAQLFEIPLREGWTLQPGARYLANFGRFFKSLGLIRTRGAQRTWLTYSEGFRRPTLFDRYSVTSTDQGNAALKPESARQVELGFEKSPSVSLGRMRDRLSGGAALYAIDYRNTFERQQIGTNLFTKVNAGSSYAYGFEMHERYGWKAGGFTLAYGFLEGKNRTTGAPLRFSPRHQFSASAEQGLGPLIFELRDTYWSKYYDFDSSGSLQPLPDWNTVDFTVRSMGMSSWEIKAGLLNIFDRPREFSFGYPEPQRTLFVSALRYL